MATSATKVFLYIWLNHSHFQCSALARTIPQYRCFPQHPNKNLQDRDLSTVLEFWEGLYVVLSTNYFFVCESRWMSVYEGIIDAFTVSMSRLGTSRATWCIVWIIAAVYIWLVQWARLSWMHLNKLELHELGTSYPNINLLRNLCSCCAHVKENSLWVSMRT